MRFSFVLYVCLLFLWFGVSCTGARKAAYNAKPKEVVALRPLYQALHVDSLSTLLFYQIQSDELLYAKTGENGQYFSRIQITYRIFPGYTSEQITDSGTVWISDTLPANKSHLLYGSFRIQLKNGTNGLAQIITRDENRKTIGLNYLRIYKKNPLSRENFFVCSTALPSMPLFTYQAAPFTPLRVHYNLAQAGANLQVRFYRREFPFPPPPFSSAESLPFDYKADSIFYLQTDAQQNAEFTPSACGFYHILMDTTSSAGYTLFVRPDHVTGYYSSEEMIRSMRYILNRQEYSELTSSQNQKAALDDIWLRFSPNKERARQLISIFFNRVQFSNQLFSSYMPGWKTDRGLIFIVFGFPSKVLSDDVSETWVYGESNSLGSLNFVFTKVENPFTDNDFSLNRAEAYKDSWQRTVDAWRQGRLLSER